MSDNMKNDNLQPKDLESVSGGQITSESARILDGLIRVYKGNFGKTKDDLLYLMKTGCLMSIAQMKGTSLDEAIAYVEAHWDD